MLFLIHDDLNKNPLAYEKLSPSMREFLEDKLAIHSNEKSHSGIAKLSGAQVQRDFEYSRHPIGKMHFQK